MTILGVSSFDPENSEFRQDLNEWVTRVRTLFFNGITFADNMYSEVFTIPWKRLTTDPPATITLRRITSQPMGIYVLQAKLTDSTAMGRVKSGLSIEWEYNSRVSNQRTNNLVYLYDIDGVTTGDSYEVTLLILGG